MNRGKSKPAPWMESIKDLMQMKAYKRVIPVFENSHSPGLPLRGRKANISPTTWAISIPRPTDNSHVTEIVFETSLLGRDVSIFLIRRQKWEVGVAALLTRVANDNTASKQAWQYWLPSTLTGPLFLLERSKVLFHRGRTVYYGREMLPPSGEVITSLAHRLK